MRRARLVSGTTPSSQPPIPAPVGGQCIDLDAASADVGSIQQKAGDDLLEFIVDAWKCGNLSAKQTCTICFLATAAGAVGVDHLGVNPESKGVDETTYP
jgi:hypothetical protein